MSTDLTDPEQDVPAEPDPDSDQALQDESVAKFASEWMFTRNMPFVQSTRTALERHIREALAGFSI